ncbi:MAG TPA: NADH-ubiquinone oxidoreductase-F iron-sulfur binding region domain-containing protein [Candidatus Aminicenantes bacterium]|nr:NADH-ubiquinone oxidoreductase-F iron-sulfur binding region domain-containing protein [Candidatus Aminicenantes bacterium]HRY64062.1 NADH-ubiquinone oxidoreductase-F iron-sulfur binding region domain-containing protein [Candidatus Aminicenantes bacterium]HRZ70975.1 NADH-ubiquinone oxidoreductase-F iron-sulfur binding region domain-containing protein [Candidatus Aminicenantes bacterium]
MKQYRAHLLVCAGTGCVSCGSFRIKEALEKEIRKRRLQDEIQVVATGCNGFCERGPIVMVQPDGVFYQMLKLEDVPRLVEEHLLKGRPVKKLMYVPPAEDKPVPKMKDIEFFKHQRLVVLRNRGRIDPERIDEYIAFEGYEGLARALTGMTPQGLLDEITAAGLRGRGGAGFPTGKKWAACAAQKKDPKYIICNGDEGDPGAFMDRSVLEADPHAVLEGMLIGARAIGAAKGFIYIRHEYPLAIKRVEIAIRQAREYGLLGQNILGAGFDFDLEIVQGAGAFVSGEETALIASVEGQIAMPRQRPPYPARKGLWGSPTVINNVETWATVPNIVRRGAAWFSALGTDTSKGTKIFSLVGKINNTGLVEVPMGISLRQIVYGIGGGIPGDRAFKAVQIGGPSGGCIPAKLLDLPVDYESLTAAGAMMGSGGMIVMDDKTCMVDLAKYFLNFLRDESCGKCVSCREGTQRMYEIVGKITDGQGTMEDIQLLEELAIAVKDASLCGLGQTAANPVLSTLRYFRSEYEKHVVEKRCPAMVCKEIVSAPCQYICPIDQEASSYIGLIARKDYEGAFKVIRKDNPLPSVCGRVCSRACESACRAGEIGEPIAIRALKRFVMDWARDKGLGKPARLPLTKADKVAIVGAGPSGLAAGYELLKKGYPVRIFESLPVAGGMLRVTIPDHRLPKDRLQDDLDYLVGCGLNIKTNMTLGKDFSLDDLFRQGYKAVYLATGAHRPLEMGVPGEEAEGVLQALEYLKNHHLGIPVDLGRRVVVIGGGNSAVDAARVAFRDKRVKEAAILYRRTRREMPAYPEEIEAGLEEGVRIEYLTAPVRVRTQNGRVVGVECIRMKLGEKDSSGRARPVPIPGSEFQVPADTLILAISERAYTPYLKDSDGLTLSPEWGTIIVDPASMATTRPGVFAGGDVVSGPSSVVEAMAAGKTAARAVEAYLEGRPFVRVAEVTRPACYVEPVKLTEEEAANTKRAKMPHLAPGKRRTGHEEIELGFTRELALKEAKRCLRCELETRDAKKALGRET